MTWWRGIKLGSAALAGCIGAAAGSQAPFDLTVAGDTATFNGRFGPEAAAALRAALSSPQQPVRRLVITSRGGDLRDALPIGEIIRDRGIAVTVREACLSACLEAILAASPRRSAERRALLGFVGSPVAIGLYFEAAGSPRFADMARPFAERQRAFFRSLGVRPELPLIVAAMKDPLCLHEREDRGEDDFNRYGLGFGHGIFVPSQRQLAEFGIGHVEGWAPTRARVAAMIAALKIPVGAGLVFDPDRPLPVEAEEIAPLPLPRCVVAMPAGAGDAKVFAPVSPSRPRKAGRGGR